MDHEVKEQLIKSVNNIKHKIKTIKNNEDAADIKFRRVFKPITDSVETLGRRPDKNIPAINFNISKESVDECTSLEDLNSSVNYKDFEKNIESGTLISSNCFDDCVDDDNDDASVPTKNNNTLASLNKEDVLELYTSNDINVPFGIRSNNQTLMIGDSKVLFSVKNNSSASGKTYVMEINDKHYELTPGLKELLLHKKPVFDVITEEDKCVYKDILNITNAHKRDFNPNGQLKGDKGLKYKQIIKPLFGSQNNDANDNNKDLKIGGFLPKLKKYKQNTDYVFWDDPNELIERLKLLVASKCAGNSNHDNEILSIIEELKEAKIIKQ